MKGIMEFTLKVDSEPEEIILDPLMGVVGMGC